jgi:ADP-ribose pyrophosphatase
MATNDVEVLSKRKLLDGFLPVEQAKVSFRLGDGSMSEPVERTIVAKGDAVVVLVRDETTEEFVFVRQFRYACYANGEDDAWLLEAVAGGVDPGEEPEAAARREVLEESGLRVTNLKLVAQAYASPGTATERYYCYLADAVPADEPAAPHGELEDLEIVRVSRNDLRAMLQSGELRDVKSIVCVQSLLAEQPADGGNRP